MAKLSTSHYAAHWFVPAPEVAIGLVEILLRLKVLGVLLLLSTPPFTQVQSISQESVPRYGRVIQHPSRSHWARSR